MVDGNEFCESSEVFRTGAIAKHWMIVMIILVDCALNVNGVSYMIQY